MLLWNKTRFCKVQLAKRGFKAKKTARHSHAGLNKSTIKTFEKK